MTQEFQQAGDVEDWRILDGGAAAWFDAPSHSAGAALAGRIAELTDGANLPDVDLRACGVRVRIGASRSRYLAAADVTLARAVSAAARDLGLVADPAALQSMAFAIESVDESSVLSFWRTALGYETIGGGVLGDPSRRDPAVAFHHQDEPWPLRNRIHVDVGRTPEAVESVRVAVGQEPYGAYQLTLADADGNEVDLVPGGGLSDSPDTADWRVPFGAMTCYRTSAPRQASDLATAVAGLADEAGIPLLVDLRPDGVTIDSGKDQWEDGDGAAKAPFVELAGRIQTAARELGLSADTSRLRFVQFGIDAFDIPAVRAFWTALLGYQHDPRPFLTDIYDPRRLDPVIMFQSLDAADEDRRRQRNRIRFTLDVPDDQLQARIDVAVAAGGRLVDKTPGRCLLTDPEGNEVDVVARS